MPSSRPHHIPAVIRLLRRLNPNSILDIGVGFGKWGFLFREYTDIISSENDVPRYSKPGWKVRIEGVEGHAPYLTPVHDYIYDKVHVGSAIEILQGMESKSFDFVFMGDVIEHFDKPSGVKVLKECVRIARKGVLISTPASVAPQEAVCGNPLEEHRSFWRPSDFPASEGWQAMKTRGDILLAFNPAGSSASPRLSKLIRDYPRWLAVPLVKIRDTVWPKTNA